MDKASWYIHWPLLPLEPWTDSFLPLNKLPYVPLSQLPSPLPIPALFLSVICIHQHKCGAYLSFNSPSLFCPPLTLKPILINILNLCLEFSLHFLTLAEISFPSQPHFPPNYLRLKLLLLLVPASWDQQKGGFPRSPCFLNIDTPAWTLWANIPGLSFSTASSQSLRERKRQPRLWPLLNPQ